MSFRKGDRVKFIKDVSDTTVKVKAGEEGTVVGLGIDVDVLLDRGWYVRADDTEIRKI